MKTQALLKVSDLTVSYGYVRALTSVSIEVPEGEIVALLGSNGAGKSTLVRTIIGLVSPTAGAILFDGKRIEHLSVEERVRLGIATVLEGRGMLPRMSVFENLQMGAYARPADSLDKDLEQVFTMFPVLRQRALQAAGTLSGGEQQMLAFGRALMLRPRMILMDEPSMGLAPVIVERVLDAVSEIRRAGVTVLLIEQNARMALSIASSFYVVRSGEIVLGGQVEDGALVVNSGGGTVVRLTEEDLEKAYLEGG
jgi:branched-chain amino acid transport system ATP-binding protein